MTSFVVYDCSMNAENTLIKLRGHLAAGRKVLGCEVHSGEVVILFEDRKVPAPGFSIGERCQPFAQFAVEAGLNEESPLVYLAGLPADLEGLIVWPDEIDWPEP